MSAGAGRLVAGPLLTGGAPARKAQRRVFVAAIDAIVARAPRYLLDRRTPIVDIARRHRFLAAVCSVIIFSLFSRRRLPVGGWHFSERWMEKCLDREIRERRSALGRDRTCPVVTRMCTSAIV